MLNTYVLAVSVLACLTVGGVVVMQNIKDRKSRVYGVLTVFMVLLSLANFLAIDPSDLQAFYVRTVMFTSTFVVFFIYLLSLYLKDAHKKPFYGMVSFYVTVFVAILDYTPLLFSDVITGSPPHPVPGPAILIYFAHFIGLAGMAINQLSKGFVRGTGARKRRQYRLIIVGIIPIIILAPLTSFVLPNFGIGHFVVLTPLYAFFFVACVGYAIWRHGLFDIKFAVVRSLVYILVLLSLAVVYYCMAYIISVTLFKNETTTSVSISPANIFLALILAFMFQPIKQFFDRLTDSIFYRDRYQSDDFFSRISVLLGSTTDLRGLLERTSTEIATTLKAEQAYFFLYYNNASQHHMSAGTQHRTRMPVSDARMLDAYVNKGAQGIIITEGLSDASDVRRMLISHKVSLVMPLRYSGQLIGYVLLGEQQRSGGYNSRDIKVLNTIADQLVIGIQNALSIHAVKEINASLQQRIDVATKELRSTNAQLRHLDEVKDEFMSMASHQLRTPLTSIKGYLSMVLEGDMGKITPQQQTVLSEAFNSSERMVRLIADFLNVSRLQTGKFVIEKNPIDIVNVVRGEADSLKMIAGTHDIRIEFQSVEKEIIMNIDEAKIRQVIMNFIDNAIYYSRPKSVIVVSLERLDTEIAFKVIDTGIGVPVAEQAMLFHKFFRAKNARQQRPDGTGVGLYLARKVVTAHGGKMIFSSVEGEGSTFGFRLPIKALKD